MDDGVLWLLGLLAIFVLLDIAALRFGVDSRGRAREEPLPGEPVSGPPRVPGGGVRALLPRGSLARQAFRARPERSLPLAPIARAQRRSRPFRPFVASDVYGYPGFDLGASGK